MSNEPEYLAQGLPFERRCGLAKEMLLQCRANVEEIVEGDLRYLQEKKEKYDERSTGGSKAFKELLAEWYTRDVELLSDTSRKMMQLTWDHAINMARLTYGSDATDFAQAALKHEHKGN